MRGFTLIELMIVVAIVAILASIAYPSYVDSVQRSRRADAMDALLNEAQRAERFFTLNNTYVGFAPAADSPGGFYTVAIGNQAAATFTLTATATGAQAGDNACPTLTLNQAGARGPDEACWNR
jgi:type IV pilus assembly protein PilE